MDSGPIHVTVWRTVVQTEESTSAGMTLVCLGKEARKGKAGCAPEEGRK